jgi:hypothetical protein
MARRIYIKDGGLSTSPTIPPGYTALGSDSGDIKKKVVDTISDIGGSQLLYRKYVAMLSQSPGSAPTAAILENNLIDSGGSPVTPTFSYLGTGTWQIIGVTGSFIPSKTVIQWSIHASVNSVQNITLSDITVSDDRIEFYSSSSYDGSTNADGFSNLALTIIVYP